MARHNFDPGRDLQHSTSRWRFCFSYQFLDVLFFESNTVHSPTPNPPVVAKSSPGHKQLPSKITVLPRTISAPLGIGETGATAPLGETNCATRRAVEGAGRIFRAEFSADAARKTSQRTTWEAKNSANKGTNYLSTGAVLRSNNMWGGFLEVLYFVSMSDKLRLVSNPPPSNPTSSHMK